MKKTLVIHPKDESTVMLNNVYEGYDFDVINDSNISISELKKAIESHDRIIMLGHGTQYGMCHPELIKYGRLINGTRMYVLDDSLAPLLRTKETISIWCYSDKYFARNHIPGFHTGMIISEVNEEEFVLGHVPLNKKEIYDNMIFFSNCLHECINLPPEEMKEYMLSHYVGNDEVTLFNRKNIKVLY